MTQKSLLRLPRWLTSQSTLCHGFFLSVAILLVFGLYPVLYSLFLTFYKRNPATRIEKFQPSWNWLKLFKMNVFGMPYKVTLTYTFIALVIQLF